MKNKVFSFLMTIIFIVTIFAGLLPASSVLAAANPEPPSIVGKFAMTIDAETGEIIYAKGIDDKAYPASVTKLMTALVFAENKDKADLIAYTESANAQPAYSLKTNLIRNISVGDTMTAEDVMKALLIFSANDSAYMIADAVAGNSEDFAKVMNEKASELGLKNTNFVTANGLHDPEHYTTAYELSVIARSAYENPWIKEVINTKDARISTTSGMIALIENTNKLLGKDGNVGGKTGRTNEAGRCLVSVYERDGRTIIGVVLKSIYGTDDTQVFNDMESIINWSYEAQRTSVYENNTVLETKDVNYKPLKFFGPEKTIQVPVIIRDEVSYYENEVNKKELNKDIKLNSIDLWNLAENTKIGTIKISQREASASYDLYTNITSKDLIEANKLLYTLLAGAAFGMLIFLIVIILLIRKSIRKRKRRRYRY